MLFNTVICNARTKFNLCAANVMNRVFWQFNFVYHHCIKVLGYAAMHRHVF